MILLILAALAYAASSKADSYRMKLTLDAGKSETAGTVAVSYQNNSGLQLSEIRFRLDINGSFEDSMQIVSIKDKNGSDLSWRHEPLEFGTLSTDKGVLAVELNEPLEPGQVYDMELAYRFVCKPAIGMAMLILQDDPYTSLDAWYPKAMSFREGQWSIDDDRVADYEISIDIPKKFAFASTGAVVEKKQLNDETTNYLLRAEGVRGFTIYGSQFWKEHTRDAESLTLRCFISEVSEQWAEKFLAAAEDAALYFRQEYGGYPCEKLDIICIAMGHGSYAACNVIGIFLGGKLEEQYRWLIAHEVAHQYWGNLINQPRNHVHWVLLGLGMVMDRHYMLDRGLGDQLHRMVLQMYPRIKKQGRNTCLSQTVEELNKAGQPWSMQWNLILGHAKAYSVCSMLEDLLGETEFKGVIKRILSEHAGGLVTAADLINYCREVFKGDLDWFVSDWIEGDAELDYAISDVRKAKGGWEVEIKQKGDAAYPVVLEVETESGAKLRGRIDREQQTNLIRFETEENLKSVTIDPGGIYPDMNPEDNTWPAKAEEEN